MTEDDHKERNFEFFQPCLPMAPSTRLLKSNASNLENYFKLTTCNIKYMKINVSVFWNVNGRSCYIGATMALECES